MSAKWLRSHADLLQPTPRLRSYIPFPKIRKHHLTKFEQVKLFFDRATYQTNTGYMGGKEQSLKGKGTKPLLQLATQSATGAHNCSSRYCALIAPAKKRPKSLNECFCQSRELHQVQGETGKRRTRDPTDRYPGPTQMLFFLLSLFFARGFALLPPYQPASNGRPKVFTSTQRGFRNLGIFFL